MGVDGRSLEMPSCSLVKRPHTHSALSGGPPGREVGLGAERAVRGLQTNPRTSPWGSVCEPTDVLV